MAIVWAGNEDIDFALRGGLTYSTVVTYRRASYVRSSTAVVSSAYAVTDPFAAMTSAWMSFRFATQLVNYSANLAGFRSGLANSSPQLVVYYNGTTQHVEVRKRTAAGVYTTLVDGAGVLAAQVIYKVDLQVVDYGANGVVRLYVDGALVGEYTGDLTVDAAVSFDRFVIGPGGQSAYHITEMIVATEDTRLFSLVALAPNAAGDVNTFTSGTYAEIDEVTTSDADTMYSETPEQEAQIALTDLPVGSFIVKQVRVRARCADGVGGMGMQIGVKTGGQISLSATHALTAAWEHLTEVYDQNPQTLNRWTAAEIDALQLAFRSKAV